MQRSVLQVEELSFNAKVGIDQRKIFLADMNSPVKEITTQLFIEMFSVSKLSRLLG